MKAEEVITAVREVLDELSADASQGRRNGDPMVAEYAQGPGERKS